MRQLENESGRISVLVLGLALLIIAVLTVSLTITAVHTQRRQLYGCADAVAVSAAQVISGADYYEKSALRLKQQEVRNIVQERLGQLKGSACRVGEGVVVEEIIFEGDELNLSVSTIPRLPIASRYMSFLTEHTKIRVATLVKVAKSRSVEE
ncbi:hypothetical protein HMPREF0044_0780 [Gleimia coleocanis DSM 15436]|uniref:Uncharacterized protein n=1 Tax=Gleimia coleocanis DSM 15436 TaxID=525245 RepID=C0VZQ2_9ACTO|nr:hypothetical protein [Gleimia coleocanis]EEH63761.1 hypothetical protein HMPREF0044_0780 [Gleimia coleocanis DSM 15436]